MDFRKFVAWENLPPLVPKKDESGSSSSSKTGSGTESETEADADPKPRDVPTKPQITLSSVIEVPPSVKNVLEKLELSQLERAKKEISKKLCRIVDNVNRVYEHYKKDDGTDPEIERQYQLSQSWEERSRRSRFLDKISNVLEDSMLKIQDLQMVLESLKNWYDTLKTIDWKEKGALSDSMVDDMEKKLVKSVVLIEANIHRLIKIVQPLFEDKSKPRRKSATRPGLFKAWREKMVEKPHETEPLTPEQMLEDEPLAFARSNEVNNMIHEIIDSTVFSKVETLGVKYIAAMVASLTKAFSLLSKQCRSLKIKCESLAVLETRKLDPQIGSLQRELHTALEKKAALEIQVQAVEEKCKVLLITNEMMQKELQDANERAMVVSKVTFPRATSAKPLSKSPSVTEKAVVKPQPDAERGAKSPTDVEKGKKSQPDAGKEEKSKMVMKPFTEVPAVLPQKMPGVTLEEKESPVKILEAESRSPEEPGMMALEEEQREPLTPQEAFVPPFETTFSPLETLLPPLEGRPQDSSISLDRTVEDTVVLQTLPEVVPSQVSPEPPISEASADEPLPPEEPAKEVSEETSLAIVTSAEDEQTAEKEEPPKEKEHGPTSKLKAVQAPKRISKMGQWRRLQTSLLKKPTKSEELLSAPAPLLPPPPPQETTSVTIHDTVSERQQSPQPSEDVAAPKPEAEEESIKGTSPEAEPPVSPKQFEGEVSPKFLEDGGSPKPETEEESIKGRSPEVEPPASSKQTEEEVSPKPLEDEPAPKAATEGELAKESIPEMESPESPKPPAEVPAPVTSPEGIRGKHRVSLKSSAGKVVTTFKVKKLVKVMGEGITQKPAAVPESPEKGGVERPVTSERVEDSAADTQEPGQTQAPKRLPGKTKEAREKREMKRAGKMQADVPQPKQEEKAEEIIHGLGAKLQEVARERGGVIDSETIKEIFAEVSATIRETSPVEGSGSHLTDKQAKSLTAKKSSLTLPGAEHAAKKEKRSSSIEEAPSGPDVSSALQEFQAAILASLEDKLEKTKKGSLGIRKQSVRFQLSDPFAQRLFHAIEKKLEECFLMKQKSPSIRSRSKSIRSIHSKGELPDEEEKEIRVITPSFDSRTALSQMDSSVSSFQTEWEKTTQPSDSLHLKTWQEQEEEDEREPLRKDQEESQARKEFSFPHLPKVEEEEEEDLDKVSSPKEEEHLPKEMDMQHRESWPKGIKEKMKQPSEEQQGHTWKEKLPQLKETKSELRMKGSVEMDECKEGWYILLQERLQGEKERLQEEQERLLEERQRLIEEEKNLQHWQEMFEQQRKQWKEEEEQRQEQEELWQVQLQHWHALQHQYLEQEQHWTKQREQQKEQQGLLQEELERLKQEYAEHLKQRGKHTEEAWHWAQLKAWHVQQQQAWQREEEEQERARTLWQEQRAHHEEQLEALQQERAAKEQELKKWQEEQQERQEKLEHTWERRWEQQLQNWHRQMQKQRVQHLKWQEQRGRLTERQREVQMLKSVPPRVKVVEGSILDQLAKQYKVSPIPRERLPSTTPQVTPISSREFEEDAWELETTWFPKLFSKAGELPVPGLTEKRYWVNVEGQRKNLELLREAAQKAGISTDLYIRAKAIIHQVLYSNIERLALLFRKYKSFSHLQEVRRSLTIQLDIAKVAQDGAKMQNLYKIIEKVDAYMKKVLEYWAAKQNAVEKKRRRCLEKMIALFAQLRVSTKLHLSDPCPLMIKAGDVTKREILHVPRIGSVVLKPRIYQSPLSRVKKPQDFTFSAVVREPSTEQIESLWKTDITELGIPIGPKSPVSLLWSEAYGFPDVPRLLELDISSIRGKPLQNIKTRIQNIPRWKISGYDFMHL